MKNYDFLFYIIPPHFFDWINYHILPSNQKYKELKNEKKIWIFNCPDYGNMGDIAISFAQREFLMNYFPDYKIIMHYISDIYSDMKALKSVINPDDIITIAGGGNAGSMYPGIEFSRMFIIENFKNNVIISFPQSFVIEEGYRGRRTLKKMKRVYGKHKHLILCAREKDSFNLYKEHFNNKIIHIPDIAFYLYNKMPKANSSQDECILICRRNDSESIIPDCNWDKIEKICRSKNIVRFQDTVVDKIYTSFDDHERELLVLLDDFKSARLIITDRLHGMIFSYILGKPCIALTSKTSKSQGSYVWINKCNYIKFLEDCSVSEIENAIDTLLNISYAKKVDLDANYELLYKSIIEEINEKRE